MKIKILSKAAAALFVLVAAAVSLTMEADVVKRKIKVVGPDSKTTLGVFDTSKVSYIEVTEEPDATEDVYPNATIAQNGDLLIELTPELIFRMVRVEGGVDYTLQSTGITWTTGKTKKIETFYLGQFEVTQGLWQQIKGSVPSNQSASGDNYPVAQVSWNAIADSGDDTFLKLINAKLAEIKKNNPTIATLLGSREFRLPSEWEWEYAAAGGKNYSTLKYYFAGTSGQTPEDLETVAVNSVSPNKATKVAAVGSKKANALALYDMSGNVREWCSGLGYPGYETTGGFLTNDGANWYTTNRPNRGGSLNHTNDVNYRIASRDFNLCDFVSGTLGFRLAL